MHQEQPPSGHHQEPDRRSLVALLVWGAVTSFTTSSTTSLSLFRRLYKTCGGLIKTLTPPLVAGKSSRITWPRDATRGGELE